jgi:acyl transferase domain-containing protein
MAVQTPCSSTLVSLNGTCMVIGQYNSGSTIVGRTSLILGPDLLTRLAEQDIISPDGPCKTTSSEVNDYTCSEAIVSINVKSPSAGIRHGSPSDRQIP